jgi:hypothetical protein
LEAQKKRKSFDEQEFLLNFADMSGAFYCLGVGFFMAFLVLIVEVLYQQGVKLCRRLTTRNAVAPHQFIEVQSRV